VSWYEAVAYCNWRSAKEGLTAGYNAAGQPNLSASGYRLPTEVEWEYAATKGGSGQLERLYAGGNTLDPSKIVCSIPPASATHTANVGSKSPGGDTPQGLADMGGNAFEFCSDNWTSSVSGATDWYYFANDTSQVSYRGGGYGVSMEVDVRPAYRPGGWPVSARDNALGFRVVRK
jgi:formylglycine-generating enzyme required for sulfatase activity